jgi:hypothetical protein
MRAIAHGGEAVTQSWGHHLMGTIASLKVVTEVTTSPEPLSEPELR